MKGCQQLEAWLDHVSLQLPRTHDTYASAVTPVVRRLPHTLDDWTRDRIVEAFGYRIAGVSDSSAAVYRSALNSFLEFVKLRTGRTWQLPTTIEPLEPPQPAVRAVRQRMQREASRNPATAIRDVPLLRTVLRHQLSIKQMATIRFQDFTDSGYSGSLLEVAQPRGGPRASHPVHGDDYESLHTLKAELIKLHGKSASDLPLFELPSAPGDTRSLSRLLSHLTKKGAEDNKGRLEPWLTDRGTTRQVLWIARYR